MDDQIADEIFTLSIEAQRIENRKWEIRKILRGSDNVIPSWDEVSTQAMKLKMEAKNVNA